MRILNRLVVVLVLIVAFLPLLAAQALTAADDRYKKQDELSHALSTVSLQYRSNQRLSALHSTSEQVLEEAEKRLPVLARQKREVRLQLAAVMFTLQRMQDTYGIDPSNEEQLSALAESEAGQLEATIRFVHLRGLSDSTESMHAILRQYLVSTLGERMEQDMRERVLLRSQARLLGIIATAKQFSALEEKLRSRYEDLSGQYLVLLKQDERAEQQLHASASEQQQIQAIVAEVQAEILKMQSELARIDARIRRKVERDLIEKGIITSREGSYNDGSVVDEGTELSWPVLGRITAGFMEQSYQDHFGIPHRAVDIAVPQGTSVHSAADGVVFLARDGGNTGYSYVLVGHRGGTATLYGHLSQITVSTGQDIRRGQIVGLSGGTPGTYGAGPMTTGSHLHFEVIQNGVHIDPLLVLPRR